MAKSEAQHPERGAWDAKRHITLPKMRGDSEARLVTDCLKELPGIRTAKTDPKTNRLQVIYDTTQLDYQSLIGRLSEAGFPAAEGWTARLKAAWFTSTSH